MKSELIDTDIKINRPEPIEIDPEIGIYDPEADTQETIKTLISGNKLLIKGHYSNGSNLLNELQSFLKKKHPKQTYYKQRAYRKEYKRVSNRILIEIKKNKLVVKKAPTIGWLEKLYPESQNFLLPLPQVQGLNSSWQWYKNGVGIPVLRNKIHPYYGVYFPTRFEHLQLFDNWLKRYEGPKKSAFDIGIGSGVLSLQLMKYRFQKSFGTDNNPNAIVGLQESMAGTKLSNKIELSHGHLFSEWDKQTELIVFNPPWLPAAHDLDQFDEAIFYKKELFSEFFEEAKKRLLPDGRIVLLFSNLGLVSEATKEHPIKKELEEETRFTLDRFFKKSVKKSSTKTTREQTWRSSEEVELWVLKHK